MLTVLLAFLIIVFVYLIKLNMLHQKISSLLTLRILSAILFILFIQSLIGQEVYLRGFVLRKKEFPLWYAIVCSLLFCGFLVCLVKFLYLLTH